MRSIWQICAYLGNADIRERARERVADQIEADTRVVIGHSLGSVAAYEALCALPDHQVSVLVTLGSPLGIRPLVFDRLQPPDSAGRRAWPSSVRRWVNVADPKDVIALVKALRPLFGNGERIEDRTVHNGLRAHWVGSYLKAAATGRAIAEAFVA